MKETVAFQDHEVWQMSNGASRVLIAPDYGARLLTWEVNGQTIIYWPGQADWTRLAGVRGGNPILFPFVARHMVDGIIGRWKDANGTMRELPMHGFARDMVFEVIEDPDPYALRMRIKSTPDTLVCYPFDFIFDVIYRLQETQLEVRFETTNTGDSPMPYYAGHHFYFAVPHEERAQWQLSLPCRRWGHQNPDGSVQFEQATQRLFALNDPSLIDRFQLDFDSNQVILQDSRRNRKIVLDLQSETTVPWYDVTTWTEKSESDFFCIEPWLGLPNAIHHGYGLRMLASGQTEVASCSITVVNS
jgi:galactose mutarotase-like enzyme